MQPVRHAAGLTTDRRPQRTCLACRRSLPKSELLRLVTDAQGQLWPDLGQKAPGRGIYVCPRAECLARMSDKRLQALRGRMELKLPQWPLLLQRLGAALEQSLQRGFARLRHSAAIGRDAVMQRMWNNAPLLLLVAADAGDAVRRQIEQASEQRLRAGHAVERIDVPSCAWLGRMLGRERVAVAAMDDSPMARRLKEYCVLLGHVKVSG